MYSSVATGTGRARGKLRHPAEELVVETGSYLSHGAIVAREFALPAVVNLPGIFEALQDGDLVEVNGGDGTVCRVV